MGVTTMDRRDVLTIGSAALLLGGARAFAQSGAAANAAKVVRVYATPDGGSRVEELTISPDAKPIDITRMTAGAYRGSGATRAGLAHRPTQTVCDQHDGRARGGAHRRHAAQDRQRPRVPRGPDGEGSRHARAGADHERVPARTRGLRRRGLGGRQVAERHLHLLRSLASCSSAFRSLPSPSASFPNFSRPKSPACPNGHCPTVRSSSTRPRPGKCA